MWLWILSLSALAHPASGGAGQTSVLVVFPDRIEVDYFVDLPNDRLTPATEAELGKGLKLLIDGRPVAMRLRAPSPPPRPSSDHTVGLALRLTAPLPDQAQTLELETENLREMSNLFAGDVRIHPTLSVISCSLLGQRDGRVVRDDSLRWAGGEERRRLTVALGPRLPRWWTLLAPPGTEPVRAIHALRPGAQAALRPDRLGPELWLLSAGAAIGTGLATGSDRLRWVAGAGIGLALLPGRQTGILELLLGLGALVAIAVPRLRPLSAPLAIAGLAGATHAPGAALGLVLAFWLSGAAGSRRPPLALGLAAALAVALLARAFGGITR